MSRGEKCNYLLILLVCIFLCYVVMGFVTIYHQATEKPKVNIKANVQTEGYF